MSHDTTKQASGGLDVAVLVSVGRHPLTARARRADHDARAVELALGLEAARVRLIHAGRNDPDSEAALRDYLGMGFASLTRIDQPAGADVLPALLEALREAAPQLLFTGSRAETGEGSGLLPYLLGEALGWPVVTGIAAVESVEGGTATLLQALPRGQRRRLRVRLPALISVDEAGPAPRQSAYGPARRGTLSAETRPAETDDALAGWTLEPARARPKRLKIVKASSARERFKAAAAKAEGGGGQVLTDVTPEQGAEAIFTLLKEEGVLRH
ncbi:electron transfer flavoprotein subunit beta [Modicisalibacter coralii]|uniref:electron transfer flavoprotein subunit beta n=1 Tax=Modicisalibacter coralii TaxID=2304602 RepID=UPI00100A3518|nr:electron transfer flavoprotein subunit beta [Halomonas coralii]